MHLRIEPQLPVFILHLLRHSNLEGDIYLPVSLGHIPETGFHHSSADDIRRHHVAVLILDGLHQNHLIPLSILNHQSVWPHHVTFPALVKHFILLYQADFRSHLFCLHLLNLTRPRATYQKNDNQYPLQDMHHHSAAQKNGHLFFFCVFVLFHLICGFLHHDQGPSQPASGHSGGRSSDPATPSPTCQTPSGCRP